MPSFGTASMEKLKTCDERLQTLFLEVVKSFDCTIICGFRNQIDQDKAFAEGKSKKKWPDGEHNKVPSKAVDVMPYPVDWNNTVQIVLFAGFVLGVAQQMGIKIRWGGDWDSDWDRKDQTFHDLPHFELID